MPTICRSSRSADGNKLKVIQVKEGEGLWIVENIFQKGYDVQTHRHTGPVSRYTTSGAWKYKEYDYVNRAGSFLYEPAGSVHTLQCIEDDTQVWFQMYGVNMNLDADGNVEAVTDGAGTLAAYYACARPRVCRGRTCWSGDGVTTTAGGVDLASPDAFVGGVPHDAIAELRRTDPVHWQAMHGEPGFWAVLRHADVVHVARHPEVFSASEGGIVLEDIGARAAGDACATCCWRWTHPSTPCTGPLSPHFRARVIGSYRGPGPRDLPSRSWRRLGSAVKSNSSTRSRRRCRRRVIGGAVGLPTEDWDHIHELAERNTSSQDPELAGPEGGCVGRRRARWRCTRSGSPLNGGSTTTPRTSRPSSSTRTSAGSR